MLLSPKPSKFNINSVNGFWSWSEKGKNIAEASTANHIIRKGLEKQTNFQCLDAEENPVSAYFDS